MTPGVLSRAKHRRPVSTVLAVLALAGWCVRAGAKTPAESSASLTIRGRAQTLHVYGDPGGPAAIVSSGDGGWIHLGPHVAQLLATKGWYAVGFDTRSYLESFTTSKTTLRAEDEPGDYGALVAFAAQRSGKKPVLIGVSEGAALSVLAGASRKLQPSIAGVVGIGAPPVAELGWRWRDAVIYVTHAVPNEPTFSTVAIVDQLAPLPFAAIQSTHDEFVPASDIDRLVAHAREPKHLWMVPASDHRFSGNVAEFDARLLEALHWIEDRAPQ
jgi:pimeloyl-ACP methyl ester carboxylesterase